MRVVAEVAADGDEQYGHSEQDSESLHGFGTGIEKEEYLEGSECEEGEVFEVVLKDQVHQDQAEGVWPKELADLVVEEAMEYPVEEELHCQDQGHRAEEEVEQIVQEEVGVSGFGHELVV